MYTYINLAHTFIQQKVVVLCATFETEIRKLVGLANTLREQITAQQKEMVK